MNHIFQTSVRQWSQKNLIDCVNLWKMSEAANLVFQWIFELNSVKLNLLSAKLTKWPNTLKQFVCNFPTNFLSVFGHFVGLTLKGLSFSLWILLKKSSLKLLAVASTSDANTGDMPTYFLTENFNSKKIALSFHFWASKSLKLSNSTSFSVLMLSYFF